METMKKSTLTIFCILAGCIFFLSGIWIYFQKNLDRVELGEGERATAYQRHYLMIANDKDTGMWQSVYESASKEAESKDAYVELLSPEQMNGYSQADCLKIGIASKVDGIILDLGVSSFQLDTPERGFTYRSEDAPLDMRMDKRQRLTARDIVNDYSEAELFRIIRDYGEDRFAKNIAKHIVQARKEKPIETTGELNAIIRGAIPMKVQVTGGHPSKRTYQAIRIELNHELDVLRDTLDTMIDLLDDGGRICIITFHSLEDRIVKSNFKKNENPCTCPSNFPVCVCGKKSKGRVVTKKPVLPSEKELEENSRSKSAKLRVFERVEDGMESREAL